LIITFLSDFGLEDEWIAVCKGVIKGIAPAAEVIDISHQIESFNLKKGALVLATALPYMPQGIHLAVVDPGVGTKRKGLIIQVERGDYLVGPDNGLLIPAAGRLGGIQKAFHITEKKYMLKPVSLTFQARDIFAPVAAYLARGLKPQEFGPEIQKKDLTLSPWNEPEVFTQKIVGEVIDIDKFGTVRSNISPDHLKRVNISLGDSVKLILKNSELSLPFLETFGRVKPGKPLFLTDSSGYLCVAVNQGSAEEEFDIGVGDRLTILK